MIPLVGFIVATYCIARLLQVPVEAMQKPGRVRIVWLGAVSLVAILAIALMAFDLLMKSLNASTVPGLG